MCVNDAAQQLPRAATAIHAHHAQYLKEAQPPKCTCCEHLTRGAHAQHHRRGGYCYNIYKMQNNDTHIQTNERIWIN